MRFQVSAVALACAALLTACGGSGGDDAQAGGTRQTISFSFAGGSPVGIPPAVATTQLKATASSGGPVTFSSNTPDICSVNGDTLSLLKAGECSVTATQAGHDGYAAASARQLFVVPKRPQTIARFRNPGAQQLDGKPVALEALSSLSRPVTFSTSTPTVCAVNGKVLTKLANGMCTVTATQEGGDIYETATLVRNIPIGTEQAAPVTLIAGYRDATNTKDGGAIGASSGSSVDGWWCGYGTENRCFGTVSGDGNIYTYTYNIQPPAPNTSIGAYWSVNLHAASLRSLVANDVTPTGARIDAQAALKLKAAQNAEWITAGNNTVNVDLILGHFARRTKEDGTTEACNVRLRAQLKPTSATPTEYSLGLKEHFKIEDACGLTGLDVWNELQDFPVSKLEIGVAQGVNSTVANAGTGPLTYTTQFTLAGPVVFQ